MNIATLGIMAAFTTVISWTIGSINFTKASRLVGPAAVNRVRLFFALILLSVIVCIVGRINPLQLFTVLGKEQYFWFSLSGLIGLSIGDYYTFTSFKILGPRRATLFGCFAPAAALIGGIWLIDENIGIIGISGMLVSIFGILLLTISRTEQKQVTSEGHGNFWKGVLAGTISAVCQGLGLVLAKKGFSVQGDYTLNPIHATWIRMLAATTISYSVGFFRVNIITEFKNIINHNTNLKPILLGTLFGPVIGVSLSLFAARSIEVSVAQTILSLVPVSLLLVGLFFYKEKVTKQSIIAVLISLIGVIILAWRNKF